MTDFENELRRLIGYYPTYMRPPYFDYNAKTLAVMKELGYRVIHADLDTNDWKFDMPASIAAFKAGVANNRIVLAHDVHETTVKTLLPAMIKEVQRLKLKGMSSLPHCLLNPHSKLISLVQQPSLSASASASLTPTGTGSLPALRCPHRGPKWPGLRRMKPYINDHECQPESIVACALLPLSHVIVYRTSSIIIHYIYDPFSVHHLSL